MTPGKREGPGSVGSALLVALAVGACATPAKGPIVPLEGVYAFKAFEGRNSFEGTFSLARTDQGYEGFLVLGGTDLPLVRVDGDGSRVTLAFENRDRTMVLFLTQEARELKGRWRSLRRAGAIEAVRVSTVWDGSSTERRRRGSR